MKRFATLTVAAVASSLITMSASAGALNGTKWSTKGNKSVVQFSESGGVLSAKIIKINEKGKANAKCVKCKGALKNKPIKGLKILTGLKSTGTNQWGGGTVLDPENGKTYVGKVTLQKDGKLKLRGHIKGAPMLGRSQIWTPVK